MYLAIDIGGTKTLIASFDVDGNITEQFKFPTSSDYPTFLKDLANSIAQLSAKEFLAGAVGIRGNIDRINGVSLLDDILVWGEAPIRDDCQKIAGCPFTLENDTKLAGLSEALLVRSTYKRVLYITISTGIGSALILDGIIEPDMINSEIGKSVYEHEGTFQQWEDFASGAAIFRKYGCRASDIHDPETWQNIAQNFAIGIINAITAFTPEVIIIGGGVGAHFQKFEQPLRAILTQLIPNELAMPALQGAKFPEEAVIYGCYELAKVLHGTPS